MHLSIKSQTKDGKPAIMCIEKPIRLCIILSATPEEAETFATLAEALGVTDIYTVARNTDLDNLYNTGWMPSQASTLMIKHLGAKK